MNFTSFLANKCFEFLLHCDGESDRKYQRSSPEQPVHPPWSLDDREFKEKCDRCGTCLEQCPSTLLVTGPDGFPAVDFSRGGCLFCGLCAKSCTRGAFTEVAARRPWWLMAVVTEGCLARQNVFCRTCGEHCPADAIGFSQQAGGVGEPRIEQERCSGCGACRAACPVGGIRMVNGNENIENGGKR